MDTYVSAMLRLPHFLEDEDVDQDYPAEVDDEYITETEIRSMLEGRILLLRPPMLTLKLPKCITSST